MTVLPLPALDAGWPCRRRGLGVRRELLERGQRRWRRSGELRQGVRRGRQEHAVRPSAGRQLPQCQGAAGPGISNPHALARRLPGKRFQTCPYILFLETKHCVSFSFWIFPFRTCAPIIFMRDFFLPNILPRTQTRSLSRAFQESFFGLC